MLLLNYVFVRHFITCAADVMSILIGSEKHLIAINDKEYELS